MKKNITKDQKGFTIIEVLIVLAIAGLIVLIVLLAVPALQRNSRNTQRKNDVSAVSGAIQEAINNNNGQLTGLTIGAAGANASAKTSQYTTADITGSLTNAAAVATVTPAQGTVQVNNFSKCPATVPATGAVTTNTNATNKSITLIYQVETSGGFQNQCQDL